MARLSWNIGERQLSAYIGNGSATVVQAPTGGYQWSIQKYGSGNGPMPAGNSPAMPKPATGFEQNLVDAIRAVESRATSSGGTVSIGAPAGTTADRVKRRRRRK